VKNLPIDLMCCPICSGSLEDKKIINILECTVCKKTFNVVNGVPVFNPEALSNDITAKAFSEQWENRRLGLFEGDDIFGFKEQEYVDNFCFAFDIDDIKKSQGVVVEAGIGSGCLAISLAKASPNTIVIGIDISETVFSLSKNAKELPNLYLIQCDLVNPPIKKDSIDKVYSSGVLHHIKTPKDGIDSLWKITNKEGKFYFWVYPSYSFCAYDALRNLLGKPFKWHKTTRLFFSWTLAPIMWLYFKSTKKYSYKANLEKINTIAFRIFDNISPEYQHRLSKQQIQTICEDVGIRKYEIINDLGIRCSH